MTTPFEEDHEPRKRRSAFAWFRSSFLTGLVVIAPIGLTLWLIWTVAGWVDSWVLPFVPVWLRPDQYVGLNIRGIGVLVFLIFTIAVGWMAKGIIGKSLIRWAESVVQNLPVVRSVVARVVGYLALRRWTDEVPDTTSLYEDYYKETHEAAA